MPNSTTKNIAILASGGGSNAKKILAYFQDRDDVNITLIITNKKNAGVISHARDHAVTTLHISRPYLYDSEQILTVLQSEKIDLIVLAGFLWLVPSYLVKSYPNKIVNIHPALLPKYGGKGMYGHHVHKAVKDNNEQESGMTIHYVNERFDEGGHIFQALAPLDAKDSPEDIGKKVLALEHMHYARVIDELLN